MQNNGTKKEKKKNIRFDAYTLLLFVLIFFCFGGKEDTTLDRW